MTANPNFWSDIDGTAVEIAPYLTLRNALKHPLAMLDGYADFLEGMHDEGVAFNGFASRRSDIWPRRVATQRSLGNLALPSTSKIVLAGSEESKARTVIGGAENVAMIEDRPHRFGSALLRVAAATPEVQRQVLLGVVHHPKSGEYMRQFIGRAQQYDAEVVVGDDRVAVRRDGLDMTVVMLPPYSKDAGKRFADETISSIR